MTQISASLLAANPLCLEKEIEDVAPLVDRLHLDVMDGHFVPNLALGVSTIQSIPEIYRRDIHLMVADPIEVVRWLHVRATDTVYFHPQNRADMQVLIDTITALGAEPGLAIGLDYDLEAHIADLAFMHSFLVMGVKPGFSGQKFNESAVQVVSWLRKHFPEATIAVDGGINAENAALLKSAGADILVTGNYLFEAVNRKEALQLLRANVG